MAHIYVVGHGSSEIDADFVEICVHVYVHGKSDTVLSKAYDDATTYIKRTVYNIDAAASIEVEPFGRRVESLDTDKLFDDGESHNGFITVLGNVKIKAKNNRSLVSVVTDVCSNYNTLKTDEEPKKSKLFNYGIQGSYDKVALAIFADTEYIYSDDCRNKAYTNLVKLAYNDAVSKASLFLSECETGLNGLQLSNVNLSSSKFVWLADGKEQDAVKQLAEKAETPCILASLDIAVEFQV